jgi:hypothetical protein
VTSLDDFLALVKDEIGLSFTVADSELSFDRLPDWDSVLLLALLGAVERATGRTVSLPDILAAETLGGVYDVVARA